MSHVAASLTTQEPLWLTSRFKWLLLLLVAVAPGIAAINGPFFFCDDFANIHRSPIVRGLRPVWSVFYKHHFSHYAPLHEILIWCQCQLFGGTDPSPLGFRLFSLLLHFGAAAACWQMLRRLTRREGVAFGIALLWAAHPSACESVGWVVEQKTLASGLFVFCALAVWFDDQRPNWRRIAIASVLMLIGGLFKSQALVVAPLAVLYEVLRQDEQPGPGRGARLLMTLPLIVVAGFLTATALWAIESLNALVEWHTSDFLLHLPAALLLYFKVALLPWTASAFHDLERVTSVGHLTFWGAILLWAAILSAFFAIVVPRHRRLLSLAALSYVAGIGPMLNISPWTLPGYDRYQYLALPFALWAFVLVVESLLERFGAGKYKASQNSFPRWIAWAFACTTVVLLGFFRGGLYADELAVNVDATRKAPGNAWAHTALANTLIGRWYATEAKGGRLELRQYVHTIIPAVEAAQRCWNFEEFHPVPAPLLVAAARVVISTDKSSQSLAVATRWLTTALENPKWRRFENERNDAWLLKGELQLTHADRKLAAAMQHDTPVEQRIQAALGALQDLELSRKFVEQSGQKLTTASLEVPAMIEIYCWRRLAELQPEKRATHRARAQKAAQQIPSSSVHRSQIESELKVLEALSAQGVEP